MIINVGPRYMSQSPSRPLIQLLDDTRLCGIEEFLDGRPCSFFLSLFLRQGLRRWSRVIPEVQPFVLFILHWRSTSFKYFREESTVRAPVEFCNPSDSQRQVAGAEDVGGGR